MANELHVLLTVQGGYSGSGLTEETWQFGIRYRVSDDAPDPLGDLPTDWGVVAENVNRDETNWTISGNWSMAGPSLSTFSADDWLNDQVAPAVSAFINTGFFSNQLYCTKLNAYPIGPNGKAVPAPPYASGTPMVLTYKAASRPTGTATGGIAPLQIAPVASWRTPQIGRRGRGRIYIPGVPLTQIDATSRLKSSYVSNQLTNSVNLLEDTSVWISVSPNLSVRPIVTGAPYTKYGVINQVRIGDVADTQRRRRRSLVETYSSATPTYP